MPNEALKLYRHVLRSIKQLPRDRREYYRRYAIQNFLNFSEEADPERVRALIEKGKQDVEWVLQARGNSQGVASPGGKLR